MPPLNEDDKKEVAGLIQATLGLEEGQRLTDVVANTANAAINAYDKRTSKDREKAAAADAEWRKSLDETLAALKPKADAGEGGTSVGTQGGTPQGGQDTEVAKLRQQFEKEAAELRRQVEAERQARVKQEEAAAESARRQADRDLRDAIRSHGIAKDGGNLDPETIDFVIAHLHGDRVASGMDPIVRKRESGDGYEMQFGKDSIGEPTWKPLPDALRGWSDTSIGKRFKPAVPGAGTPTINGTQRNGAQAGPNLSDPHAFDGMTPSQIRAEAEKISVG